MPDLAAQHLEEEAKKGSISARYVPLEDEEESVDVAQRIEFHNVGTRPAFAVELKTVIGFRGADVRVRITNRSGLAEIAQGARKTEFILFESSKGPIRARVEAGESLFISGTFIYDDALGVRRERGFEFNGRFARGILALANRHIIWDRVNDPAVTYDRRAEKRSA